MPLECGNLNADCRSVENNSGMLPFADHLECLTMEGAGSAYEIT